MDEMTRLEQWLGGYLEPLPDPAAKGEWALPFSFQYDGRPAVPAILDWPAERETFDLGGGVTQTTITYRHPDSGLKVTWEIKRFADFPAVEWVLHLENEGPEDTPIISDLKSLRARFDHLASETDLRRYVDTLTGGRTLSDDFNPQRFTLAQYSILELDSPRTASDRFLPFFNLSSDEPGGVWLGLGWLGAWKAVFQHDGWTPVIEAGLRRTHFKLRPGERLRGARILLMLWEGDRLRAQNLGRQLILTHYVPKTFGDPPRPPLTTNICFTHDAYGDFLEKTTAENVLRETPFHASLGIDYLVIDAGWYELPPEDKLWWLGVGNWTLDRSRYPDGLAPIAAALAEKDAKLTLWFWPMSNGHPQSRIAREHPEFLLGPDKGIVDIGNPDAREWLLARVADLWDQGMRGYRTDGEVQCLELDALDPPDRIGMGQIRQVQGMYALWDEILRRHPGIVMEGCSSGGRSIELEMISRFAVHQKSDRWFNSEEDQISQYGFNMFLPGSILNIPTTARDDYGFRSSMAAQICLAWNQFRDDFDEAACRALVAQYKKLRHLLTGDYYPMTSLGSRWLAMQFHRPDLEEGMALVFHRVASTLPEDILPPESVDAPAIRLHFRGLDPAADYAVRSANTGETIVLSGSELIAGREVSLPSAPSSDLITYSRSTAG